MSRRRRVSAVSFVDFFLVVSLAFVVLFLLAVPHMNPVADAGQVTPRVEIMVTAEWDDESTADMDLWSLGPNKHPVGFSNKDGRFIILDRDDLGTNNDTVVVNGETIVIKRNIETVSITQLVPGEYFFSIHHFMSYLSSPDDKKGPVAVTVTVIELNPFSIVFTGTVVVPYKQEVSVVSFMVNEEGLIEDVRTDVNVTIRQGGTRYDG